MAKTLPGANHNQSDKDEGRDAGYACWEGIPIGHFHALPRARSFSGRISYQLDRDCEPANNFGALWKVRSWRLAEVGWRSCVRCWGAGSTGRRNTGVKSLCWGFKLQGLTWSFV